MGKTYDGASASTNGYVNKTAENYPKMIQNKSLAEDIRSIVGRAKDNVVNPTMIMPSKELQAIKELEKETGR